MTSGFSHALLVTGSRTWDAEEAMKAASNEAWTAWGPSAVARPVLLSGHCPRALTPWPSGCGGPPASR
jgi:hypothetical protein